MRPAVAAPPPVEQISLSPSGLQFAFVAVVGEQRTLIAMTADGKSPLFATSIGPAKVVDVRWVGEDFILMNVFHTVALGIGFDVTKAKSATVVSINLKARKSISIFENHFQALNLVEWIKGGAEIGGNWCSYFAGITCVAEKGPNTRFLDPMSPDLYRVDLDSGAVDTVAHASDQSLDWLVGRDGRVIARTPYDQRSDAWKVRMAASADVSWPAKNRPSRRWAA